MSVSRRYEIPVFTDRGLSLIKGDGVYLYDDTGRAYLDLTSGYGAALFGHADAGIMAALTAQLGRLSVLHGSFANDVRTEASRSLLQRCGGGLSRVYMAGSGAEAIEAGLKFAVLATGRKTFVACRGGYHGKTLGALSATDGTRHRGAFEPLLWDFHFVPFGDLRALEEALAGGAAAFLVEPIQGESGIHPAPPGFLRDAARLCRAGGALLIVDEIQTGAGRTGSFLASEPDGLDYDILALGKGLAGGLPFGATLVSERVATAVVRGAHTSTFGGNPLAAAGVLAVLDRLDAARLDHIVAVGAELRSALRRLNSPRIRDVRGRGLMIGVELTEGRDRTLKGLQAAGILALPAGDAVVRFLPPYIVTREHGDHAARTLGAVLAALDPERIASPCAAS